MDKDILMMKHFERNYSERHIMEVVELLSSDKKISIPNKKIVEEFLLINKDSLEMNWQDFLVVFCSTYEIDMNKVLTHTSLIEMLKEEYNDS